MRAWAGGVDGRRRILETHLVAVLATTTTARGAGGRSGAVARDVAGLVAVVAGLGAQVTTATGVGAGLGAITAWYTSIVVSKRSLSCDGAVGAIGDGGCYAQDRDLLMWPTSLQL